MVQTSWVEHIRRSKPTEMVHTSWVEHIPMRQTYTNGTNIMGRAHTYESNVHKWYIHHG